MKLNFFQKEIAWLKNKKNESFHILKMFFTQAQLLIKMKFLAFEPKEKTSSHKRKRMENHFKYMKTFYFLIYL